MSILYSITELKVYTRHDKYDDKRDVNKNDSIFCIINSHKNCLC